MLDKIQLLGADLEDAMRRFQGNEALYKRLLLKFPDQAAKENYDKALENVHTMKGLAANLSLSNLYDAYSEVVDLLRSGKYTEAEGKYLAILPIEEEYNKAILGE